MALQFSGVCHFHLPRCPPWSSAQCPRGVLPNKENLQPKFKWNHKRGFLRHLHCTHCAYWLMQAQRIQCGCRATQSARARERALAPPQRWLPFFWTICIFFQGFLPCLWQSGQPCEPFMPTQSECASVTTVLSKALTQCVHQWAWMDGESRGVEH